LLLVGLVVFYVNRSYAKVAPDYIVPCKGHTPECLKKTIQEVIPLFVKGVPSLDIDVIDPLKQDYVAVELPGGFKVELFDGTVTGFRKCIVDSVSYNDGEANLDFHCNVTIKGKYKAKGQILVVAINGDGDAKIRIGGAAITSKIKFHDVERDGVVYHEVKSYDIKYKIEDKVTFALTNLFQGNPELSQTVLQFLNENWKQLVDEFGKPIFDKIVEIAYSKIGKFFEKIPKSELFD
ncbi:circadian clock-controlled protein daywake, partial [Manduca sexta]|uniref:circadian clock-controlled protein daywake n=1 Tax=Manduca sexta TaxID=7130 RepID=UPI0018909B3D